jgi:hypothetical protein
MDAERFESVLRTVTVAPTRRAAVRAVMGMGFGGLSAAGVLEAEAKKK